VGAALVRDSAGRVDLRAEGFLVGEITVASVIVVSVGEIGTFAIAGLGILSILASMALNIQITTNTSTRITTHIRITTMMLI
jgi:hypothetical protein